MIVWSVIKDVVFVCLSIMTIYTHRDGFYKALALHRLRLIWRVLWVWIVLAIAYSLWLDIWNFQIVTWLKYTIWPFVICVVWLSMWMSLRLSKGKITQYICSIFASKSTFARYCTYICICIWVVMLIWLMLQLMKLVRPDRISSRGYGPVGDYMIWAAPPLYYRTWPGGIMRLQWLFSWPNNFGYFLVWVFPILFLCTQVIYRYHIRSKIRAKWLLLLWMLFIVCTVWTFSRAVIIWCAVQLMFLIYVFRPSRRKNLLYIVLVSGLVVLWLSIYKRWSTVAHIEARLSWGHAFLNNVWWYGLGSSGPSVHRNGVYLPENQYLQYALDTGIRGVLCVWAMIYIVSRQLYAYLQFSLGTDADHMCISTKMWVVVMLWFAVIWLFLHVLEDSMVNYLILLPVFVVFGLALAHTNHTH